MCQRCKDRLLAKLEDKLGVRAEKVAEVESKHNKEELTATLELKTSPSGAERIQGCTVLISNYVEDADSGVGIAVIIAVNGRFVELADSGALPSGPTLIMSAVALKDAMEPLARAMQAASRNEPRAPDEGDGDARGRAGSKLN